MEIKSEISNLASNFLNKNFSIKADYIEIQNTKKDFVGDITIVLFPYLKNINKDKSDFGKKLPFDFNCEIRFIPNLIVILFFSLHKSYKLSCKLNMDIVLYFNLTSFESDFLHSTPSIFDGSGVTDVSV